MSASLPTVPGGMSVPDAEAVLLTAGTERLLIVDEERRVVGAVSAASLIQSRLTGFDRDRGIVSLAGRSLLVCEPGDPIESLAPRFRDACHAIAIVLDDGRAVGTVRRLDLLRHLMQSERSRTSTAPDDRFRHAAAGPHCVGDQASDRTSV